jgi:7-carboxy-7-deazaguanine synthase
MELPTLTNNQDELILLTPPGYLAVSEIFYSIQGEGKFTGYPMIFVRLNLCHVGCKFCDTKYTWEKITHNTFYNANTLLEKIKSINSRCNRICFTGGEPFEQAPALLEICKHLSANNLKIHIETSGAVIIPYEFNDVCTWIVCSPKKFYPPNFESRIDEIKLLVTQKFDVGKIKNWISKFKKRVWVSIQPIEPEPPNFGNPEGLSEEGLAEFYQKVDKIREDEKVIWNLNKAKAVQVCLETGWQLSFQIHKQLQIR